MYNYSVFCVLFSICVSALSKTQVATTWLSNVKNATMHTILMAIFQMKDLFIYLFYLFNNKSKRAQRPLTLYSHNVISIS